MPFIPELFLSLKDYNRKKLLKDISAGVIVGIIALPLSIALSIASGAAPAAGLITAIFAGAAVALLGGSKTQVTGPTGAFVVIVAGVIAQFGFNGLLLATLMAGIITLLSGLFKLGRVIKFIPLSVIEGFTAGIAATIFIGQLNDFLGLKLTEMPSESLEKFTAVMGGLLRTDLKTFLLGALAVAIMLVVPRISKKLPAALTAIVICTLLNIFLGCATLGGAYGNVSVKLSFSAAFIDFSMIKRLLIPSLTISLLISIESLLSAVVADSITGTKHNPHTELIGQGAANIISPFFGGLPATGAIARTSANIKNGAVSPVSSLVHSVMVLILGMALMPLAVYIPMTVFAAILITVCKNMLNMKEIKKISKNTAVDAFLLILTFALTVIFNLVVAICVSTVVALAVQAVKHFRHRHYGSSILLDNIFRLEGVINYINCKKIFENKNRGSQVILDMEKVTSIDFDGVKAIIKCAERKEILSIKIKDKKIADILKRHKEINDLIA